MYQRFKNNLYAGFMKVWCCKKRNAPGVPGNKMDPDMENMPHPHENKRKRVTGDTANVLSHEKEGSEQNVVEVK